MPPEYLEELEKPQRSELIERRKPQIFKVNPDGSIYSIDQDGNEQYFPAKEAQYHLLGKKPKAESYGSMVMELAGKALEDRIKNEDYNKRLKFICG